MKKLTFEDYLQELHARDYIGLDDDMPDDYERWSEELGWEELLDYATDYGDKRAKLAIKDYEKNMGKNVESNTPETSLGENNQG